MSKTDSTQSESESRPTTKSRRRRWLFRGAAVLFGLSLFAVAELVCVIFDWGRPTDYPDPYVGFQDIHPLFVLDKSGERYEIPKSRLGFFAAESFPATKGDSTFRVFCLGGSTVQGRPYSSPTSFTRWLELSLHAGDSRRDWEIINCGGISYASYRLVPILKECLNRKPDLIILCTGHNEFLEERSYEHIKHAPGMVAVPMKHLSRLRTFTLLRSAVLSATRKEEIETSPDRTTLKTKVDALLDYNRGTEAYHRDEVWRAGVIEHYEFNVRRMIRLARNAKVPIILVLPPSNFKHPPFKSEHAAGLSAKQLAEWESLTKEARTYVGGDLQKSVALFDRAIAIDDRYAHTYFELARCCHGLWQRKKNRKWWNRANEAYRRAREEDICPLRILKPMEDALRRVAEDTQTPLIDAHDLLQRDESSDGILGDELLVDHIHPSPFVGHKMIAAALAGEIKRQGFFEPTDSWGTQREAAFRDHQKSLDDLYTTRGKRTLDALRMWAAGRADGPPIESRKQAPSK